MGFLHTNVFFLLCSSNARNSVNLYANYSGEDAYKKIRSGATLVQLYTALAYGGPALIPRIKVSIQVKHRRCI